MAQRKKLEQIERARQFEEERKAHVKRARQEAAEMGGEGAQEAQEAKDIMDNLLLKLRSGELTSAAKRRSGNSRRVSLRRERRRTRSESVAMRAEDLLKHIQSEEENNPVPALPSTSPTSGTNSNNSDGTGTRSRSGSRRLAASERMLRLASLAEEEPLIQ